MSDEKTPEDRLREYKKLIAQLSLEDRKREETARASLEEEIQVVPDEPPPEPAGPPKNLQSPAKQELRSSLGTTRTRTPAGSESISESPHKERVMLRARQLAIEGALQDIKSRKERLELLFKRKMITREEFEKRKHDIVREGQELLREKSEVDEKLAA